MPNLTEAFYEETKARKTRHYVETGAYLGDGIQNVMGNYECVHSIELTQKYYDSNVARFEGKNVRMYHGDSKRVLPGLLATLPEPVTVFLDAHYSGGATGFGEEETPLLFELEVLRRRPYDDIIIVDDCRLLGAAGECGISANHPVYPKIKYDWRDITEPKIQGLMKAGYVLLKNSTKRYTDGASDQFILVKKSA